MNLLNAEEPGLQPGSNDKSISIHSPTKSIKSKSAIIPWDEDTDYAAMHEHDQYSNNHHSKCQRCRQCSKRPKPCNCCMCGYICLLILLLIAIILIIIIYGIAPAEKQIFPQIQNVYIQLFDYGLGEDEWHFGPKKFIKIFMNATGAFAVEAKNPNIAGFYMHDWSIDAISTNLYQNPEQWGNVYCCADIPNWNKSHPFIRGYDNFTFDERQWFGAGDTRNITFVLFVEHLSEELFYVGWEASWMNDWRLPISLHGDGWGKSKIFGLDIKVLIDCDIVVNASNFFPLDPPTPPPFIINDTANIGMVDVNNNGNAEIHEEFDGDPYFKDTVGRIPPRKYVWQVFPVLNLSCSFGIGGFKFG